MFPNSKDLSEIANVEAACVDKAFWVFIAVFLEYVIQPLEDARHWGMVCGCCRLERMMNKGKRTLCNKASRRLHEAKEFIEALVATLLNNGLRLTVAVCEGYSSVHIKVSTCLRKVVAQLGIKFR